MTFLTFGEYYYILNTNQISKEGLNVLVAIADSYTRKYFRGNNFLSTDVLPVLSKKTEASKGGFTLRKIISALLAVLSITSPAFAHEIHVKHSHTWEIIVGAAVAIVACAYAWKRRKNE